MMLSSSNLLSTGRSITEKPISIPRNTLKNLGSMLKTMLMLTLKMKPRLLKPLRTRQSLMPLMLLLILPRPRVILPRRLTKMQKLTQRKTVHLLKKRPQLVL
jgi:hypothetical protein